MQVSLLVGLCVQRDSRGVALGANNTCSPNKNMPPKLLDHSSKTSYFIFGSFCSLLLGFDMPAALRTSRATSKMQLDSPHYATKILCAVGYGRIEAKPPNEAPAAALSGGSRSGCACCVQLKSCRLICFMSFIQQTHTIHTHSSITMYQVWVRAPGQIVSPVALGHGPSKPYLLVHALSPFSRPPYATDTASRANDIYMRCSAVP